MDAWSSFLAISNSLFLAARSASKAIWTFLRTFPPTARVISSDYSLLDFWEISSNCSCVCILKMFGVFGLFYYYVALALPPPFLPFLFFMAFVVGNCRPSASSFLRRARPSFSSGDTAETLSIYDVLIEPHISAALILWSDDNPLILLLTFSTALVILVAVSISLSIFSRMSWTQSPNLRVKVPIEGWPTPPMKS